MGEASGPEVTSGHIFPEAQVQIVQFWLQILLRLFGDQLLLW
jgi:hypothetical protein